MTSAGAMPARRRSAAGLVRRGDLRYSLCELAEARCELVAFVHAPGLEAGRRRRDRDEAAIGGALAAVRLEPESHQVEGRHVEQPERDRPLFLVRGLLGRGERVDRAGDEW